MKLFITCFAAALLLTACGINSDANCKTGCDNVNCTYEFKMITATIVDSDAEPVALDTYELFYTDSKEAIDIKEEPSLKEQGRYIIATDAMMDELDCDGTSITLSYEIDNQQMSQEYLIGKDCCHIQKKDNESLELAH